MAFLKLSGLLDSITGKLNGSYFSQKKGGTTINTIGAKRGKVSAGRATLQTQQNLLAFTARSWAGLNNEQRGSWASFASGITWRNKAGIEYTPTGYDVYNYCNLNRNKIALTGITNPVTSTGTANVENCLLYFDLSDDLIFEYDGTSPSNNGIAIYASSPQSAGVKWPRGGYRLIYKSGAIVAGTVNLTANYQSVFGYLPAKGSLFFKIELVVADSGIQNGVKLTKADSGFA